MSIGDTIWCRDEDDMIRTMHQLCKAGIETDWDVNEIKNGNYILRVTEVTNGRDQDREKRNGIQGDAQPL